MKDEKKSGGKYVTITGIIKKIDLYEQIITLADNTVIPIKNVIDLERFAHSETT